LELLPVVLASSPARLRFMRHLLRRFLPRLLALRLPQQLRTMAAPSLFLCRHLPLTQAGHLPVVAAEVAAMAVAVGVKPT
jgi:hypothetical protein